MRFFPIIPNTNTDHQRHRPIEKAGKIIWKPTVNANWMRASRMVFPKGRPINLQKSKASKACDSGDPIA
jgi:hypothetical protein